MSKLKKMPFNMKIEHYTHRVTWSAEDEEHLGLCAEFSLLSWLAGSPEKALSGIRQLVAVVVADMLSLFLWLSAITAVNSGFASRLNCIGDWPSMPKNSK